VGLICKLVYIQDNSLKTKIKTFTKTAAQQKDQDQDILIAVKALTIKPVLDRITV